MKMINLNLLPSICVICSKFLNVTPYLMVQFDKLIFRCSFLSGLKDQFAFCFKLDEFCHTEPWVGLHCRKTCCKDSSAHCAEWEKKGYCFKDENQDWMKLNCTKTCGYC